MAALGEAFLSEGNVAGTNMLKLCARGSAIISELLRLSENIPSAFLMQDARYALVLLDYQFFKNESHYDSRISADQALIELDDELKENNISLIVRFYQMFESIYKFIMDLLRSQPPSPHSARSTQTCCAASAECAVCAGTSVIWRRVFTCRIPSTEFFSMSAASSLCRKRCKTPLAPPPPL
jgi:hypothetical protein